MCMIIDFETRRGRDSEKPTLEDFLAARFGPGFRISDDWDPDWGGSDTVTWQGARAAIEDYEAKFGPSA